MGKLTFIVEGDQSGSVQQGAGSIHIYDTATGESARIIAFGAHVYRDQWKDENGNHRQPTIHEVCAAIFSGFVAGMTAAVKSHEEEVAALQARATVQPINPVKVS
ncbi:MAG: hypothetical protein CTY28_10205 [Hyphomicrobium sp.]|nr:MAG: hypothetical protein CTY28_10205 [Hyphomicrobium sp.]